jgi:hypothetical protein
MNPLQLHIHNDIESLFEYNIISLAFYGAEIYIMQEDRIVFVGKQNIAEKFYNENNLKYCKELPYINKKAPIFTSKELPYVKESC